MAAQSTPVFAGFRQRMAWLHTWSSLWFCWLMFAIFLTGTLSVFNAQITQWMQPERMQTQDADSKTVLPGQVITPQDHATAVNQGLRQLEKLAPDSNMWEIWPRAGEDTVRIFWLDQHGMFADRRVSLSTGEVTPEPPRTARDTAGGNHFVEFHHELHTETIGLWIVGIASIAMLVALVSGIVTHRRIFKDFFTFRPGKGQRSWLDAHNALGVLTLPFLFMITYTGLVISVYTYMPAAQLAQGVVNGQRAPLSEFGPAAASHGQPAQLTALSPLIKQAEATLNSWTYAVVIEHPGDTGMKVKVYGAVHEAEQPRHILTTRGFLTFDGVSGALLATRLPHNIPDGSGDASQRTMADLHEVKFADPAIRWLYFICGMAGSAMMATGAILFMVKRRQKSLREFGRATPQVYRLIEILNVAAIAGLALACIGYFWGNRLLPLTLDERHDWEVMAFFGVWLLALIHAALRPSLPAWYEQLTLTALLCLTLPLLNWLTTGQHLLIYLAQGEWGRAGMELTTLLFGILLLRAAWKVRQKIKPAPVPAAKHVRMPSGGQP